MENGNGLLVDFIVREANGRAESDAAIDMIDESVPGNHRITLDADKVYDTRDFRRRLP